MQRKIQSAFGNELADTLKGSETDALHKWAAEYADKLVKQGNSMMVSTGRKKAYADAKIFGNLADALAPFLRGGA